MPMISSTYVRTTTPVVLLTKTASSYAQRTKPSSSIKKRERVRCQFKLASLYESGRDGVPKNLPKAAALYLKAAEQGRADAQYNLAMMYESGHGVAKDAAEAARWFKTYNENEQTK